MLVKLADILTFPGGSPWPWHCAWTRPISIFRANCVMLHFSWKTPHIKPGNLCAPSSQPRSPEDQGSSASTPVCGLWHLTFVVIEATFSCVFIILMFLDNLEKLMLGPDPNSSAQLDLFLETSIYALLAVLGLHCCVGFSLVVASKGYSWCHCGGFSLRGLLLWTMGPRVLGFSSCGQSSWAPGHEGAGPVAVLHGLSCSTARGIFPDQGSNSCIGRQVLYH